MKRAKKLQKLQKIQGIVPEKNAAENKGKAEAAHAGDLADGISENFDKFELWFIENGKKIVAVCIVILIAVAAYYSVQYVIKKNKAEVSSKFANADTAEKLMTVLNENSNAPEAFAASLAVAADHVAKKEYDKAVDIYDDILEKDKDNYDILLDKALALHGNGDVDSAIDIYNKLLVRKQEPRVVENLSKAYVYKGNEFKKSGFKSLLIINNLQI